MTNTLSAEQEKFDDLFGKAGPEKNCDSIGRRAGCDDCSSNIERREEMRDFLLASNQRVRLQTLQEVQGMIEGEKVDDKEHTHACHYKRKGCDCGKLERMIHNKVLQEVINLIK